MAVSIEEAAPSSSGADSQPGPEQWKRMARVFLRRAESLNAKLTAATTCLQAIVRELQLPDDVAAVVEQLQGKPGPSAEAVLTCQAAILSAIRALSPVPNSVDSLDGLRPHGDDGAAGQQPLAGPPKPAAPPPTLPVAAPAGHATAGAAAATAGDAQAPAQRTPATPWRPGMRETCEATPPSARAQTSRFPPRQPAQRTPPSHGHQLPSGALDCAALPPAASPACPRVAVEHSQAATCVSPQAWRPGMRETCVYTPPSARAPTVFPPRAQLPHGVHLRDAPSPPAFPQQAGIPSVPVAAAAADAAADASLPRGWEHIDASSPRLEPSGFTAADEQALVLLRQQTPGRRDSPRPERHFTVSRRILAQLDALPAAIPINDDAPVAPLAFPGVDQRGACAEDVHVHAAALPEAGRLPPSPLPHPAAGEPTASRTPERGHADCSERNSPRESPRRSPSVVAGASTASADATCGTRLAVVKIGVDRGDTFVAVPVLAADQLAAGALATGAALDAAAPPGAPAAGPQAYHSQSAENSPNRPPAQTPPRAACPLGAADAHSQPSEPPGQLAAESPCRGGADVLMETAGLPPARSHGTRSAEQAAVGGELDLRCDASPSDEPAATAHAADGWMQRGSGAVAAAARGRSQQTQRVGASKKRRRRSPEDSPPAEPSAHVTPAASQVPPDLAAIPRGGAPPPNSAAEKPVEAATPAVSTWTASGKWQRRRSIAPSTTGGSSDGTRRLDDTWVTLRPPNRTPLPQPRGRRDPNSQRAQQRVAAAPKLWTRDCSARPAADVGWADDPATRRGAQQRAGPAQQGAGQPSRQPAATAADPPAAGADTAGRAAKPFKYDERVRKRADREALPAYACAECGRFFEELRRQGFPVDELGPNGCPGCSTSHQDGGGAPPGGRARPAARGSLLHAVGRHRMQHAAPPTPPHFWDLGFSDDFEDPGKGRPFRRLLPD